MLDLNLSIRGLSGVGPKISEKLEKIGLSTIKDLLFYYPRKWEDYRNFTPIIWCNRDQEVTIKGRITAITKDRTRVKHMMVVKATVEDETGEIKAVWFNQGFIERMIKVNMPVTLHGKIDYDWKNKERNLSGPIIIREERIEPVYVESNGISSKIYEKIISQALHFVDNLEDWLPEEVKDEYDLVDLAEAARQIHHPSSLEALEAAKYRLAFDELFLINLSMAQTRTEAGTEIGVAMSVDEAVLKGFVSSLSFDLTNAQRKTAWEIVKDLGKSHPMNRLLEGDVGSGKTVVGAIACLVIVKSGYQAVWMAPTEILAKQHFNNLSKLLSPFEIKVALVTGSVKDDHHKADVIVGTQALIQDKMEYPRLGLLVVDEQHRFGVAQRGKLRNRQLTAGDQKGAMPHLLSMTATPIPRTLALALYGDLDISIIDELPAGRQVIKTRIVSPNERMKAYSFIKKEVDEGRQVFVVCPLINQKVKNKKQKDNEGKIEETTEAEIENSLSQAELFEVEKKSAIEEYEKLSKEIFPEFKIGLLHGKMKNKEKEEVMRDFSEGKLAILVSTAVIEVGIDVPNATVMMIEGAERFGLAQLHQFRGRVGRGKHQSYCLLFANSWSKNTEERLRALVESSDGFKLAEKDLALRGPGELAGIRQSGLPDLKMASLTDTILIQKTRSAAEKIMRADLSNYPILISKLEEFRNTRHLE